MRKTIMGTALALSLAVAGTAQANTVQSDFESFHLGSVDGQAGWKATSTTLDQEVVNTGTEAGNSLRISNAFVADSFADMPYSAPVASGGRERGQQGSRQRVQCHVQ